jgi:hypothetical protein
MKLITAIIVGTCIALALAVPVDDHRAKRQIGGTQGGKSLGGGFGSGFGQYDYHDYYGDYTNDYNYDYYDWVCSTNPPNCQLCNILGSDCCDPAADPNCVLPDTCLNNPCLAGGTCIETKTIADNTDFTCVCLPGLSGKYCQLATDYFVGAQMFAPPPAPFPVPVPSPAPVPSYGGAAPVPSYGGAAPQGSVPGPAYAGGALPYSDPNLPLNQGLGSGPAFQHQRS